MAQLFTEIELDNNGGRQVTSYKNVEEWLPWVYQANESNVSKDSVRLLFLPFQLGIYIAFVLDDHNNILKLIKKGMDKSEREGDSIKIEEYFLSLDIYSQGKNQESKNIEESKFDM